MKNREFDQFVSRFQSRMCSWNKLPGIILLVLVVVAIIFGLYGWEKMKTQREDYYKEMGEAYTPQQRLVEP